MTDLPSSEQRQPQAKTAPTAPTDRTSFTQPILPRQREEGTPASSEDDDKRALAFVKHLSVKKNKLPGEQGVFLITR
jgi:hypothetical protein